MTFSLLGISEAFTSLLNSQGYIEPYPIQQEVIPQILKRRDILGIAKTGSGKTAGYVLPILTALSGKNTSRNRYVNVLVMAPTRELTIQITEVFKLFGSVLPTRIKSLAVYGGVAINPQMKALLGVNILIATPGRLLELVELNAVKLSAVDTLVLDEADKMLSMGFKEEMDRVISLLPPKRQNLLFSATLSEEVENITQILLNNPLVVKIASESEDLDLIDQLGYFVTNERKGPLLRYLIKQNDLRQVLVFTSTVTQADNVANKLRINGIDATAVHSKKSQEKRISALSRFKSGGLRVLVTTDLLARGIDIEGLPVVINYELPRSPKDYIHRIGRTGRAESKGEALTFVTDEDKHHFRVIQKKMGRWVTMIDSGAMDLHGF